MRLVITQGLALQCNYVHRGEQLRQPLQHLRNVALCFAALLTYHSEIFNCFVTLIERNAFVNLTSLQYLCVNQARSHSLRYLNSNQLQYIPAGAFFGLPQLRYLYYLLPFNT
jgi:hypothetical protein